eukprot:7733760-Lingulodinium_polyedra.AAC.1
MSWPCHVLRYWYCHVRVVVVLLSVLLVARVLCGVVGFVPVCPPRCTKPWIYNTHCVARVEGHLCHVEDVGL